MGDMTVRRLLLSLVLAAIAVQPLVAQRVGTTAIYLEPQALLSDDDVRFPQLISFGDSLLLFYQRIVTDEDGQRFISLRVRRSEDGFDWQDEQNIGRPILLETVFVPPVYSVAANERGLSLVLLGSDGSLGHFTLGSNPGDQLSLSREFEIDNQIFVEPRIYSTSSGFFLFVSRLEADEQLQAVQPRTDVLYSRFEDGRGWGDFTLLDNPDPADNSSVLNPVLLESRDRLYLVFQRQAIASAPIGYYSELYSSISVDNGLSWSQPRLISGFEDPEDSAIANIEPRFYVNQNPRLLASPDGSPRLVFERNRSGANVQIHTALLDSEGSMESRIIRAVERNSLPVSDGGRSASYGGYFIHRDEEYILYYSDLLRRSQVLLASPDRNGIWSSDQLSDDRSAYAFPRAAMFNGKPYFIWLQRENWNQDLAGDFRRQISSLVIRISDIRADAPRAIPLSYVPGREYNRSDVEYRIAIPDDPAGVRSISYAWSADGPPESGDFFDIGLADSLNLVADAHGTWTLYLQTLDRAGNRSPVSRINYDLDLIPPAQVRFGRMPLDEDGFLLSNSIALNWIPNTEDDLSGYQIRLQYLGREDAQLDSFEQAATLVSQGFTQSSVISRTENRITLNNEDNGLWALAVRAVDRVGNAGIPGIQLLRLNKYVPVTRLTSIAVRENIIGDLVFRFAGRGFTANGLINRIIFDRDGREPWDYVLNSASGDYRLVSDRVIEDITLGGFASGDYQLILDHSERGLYRHASRLSLDANGAIKLGDFDIFTPPEVSLINDGQLSFSVLDISIMLITPLLIFIIVVTLLRIRGVVRDNRVIQAEVAALVSGDAGPMTLQQLEEKVRTMQRQGMGLRAKFTIFMLILVLAVVAVISLPLSNFILSNQQQILAQGLYDKVELTLQSLSIGAADILESDDLVFQKARDLRALTNQVAALEEIDFVTITSGPAGTLAVIDDQQYELDPAGREYIWVTTDPMLFANDQQIADYLSGALSELPEDPAAAVRSGGGDLPMFFRRYDDPRSQLVRTAQVQIRDPLRELIQGAGNQPAEGSDIARFNALASDDEYRQIQQQVVQADEQRSSATTSQELQEIEDQISILRNRLDEKLAEGISINSSPEYSVQNYDTGVSDYLFSFPVYWYEADFSSSYQGSVRLGVSTRLINNQIASTTRTIIIQISIFAAVAIAAGVAGALLLASITVNPIRKLVAGVELIRDTEVKEDLKGKPIEINTKDELHFLSETINQMTDGLIAAEKANKSVMMGKDVQKMYITLDPNPHDDKTKATFRQDTSSSDQLEFYGYYEGAKGVSGDYFYYDRIDDEHFAMIKCDVSGKDIEAALIMVTVASLFLRQFEGWSEEFRKKNKSKGTGYRRELSSLADSINDIIYRRQFKGKFAAFNMLTLNERTGELAFCNAGDNLVHMYRRKERKVVTIELPRTPAAGAMHEELVGMPITFPVDTARIEKGDILLLFTDGIDEGRRYLRHDDWTVYRKEEFEAVPDADDEERKRMKDAKQALEDEMAPIILGEDEGGLGESFSVPRIIEVVESVMSRKVYELKKFRNPAGDEELTFDFSNLESTLPNLILALMSVEKVYRLVPMPNLTREDRISIDKKIDDFLKEHFLQYRVYFSNPLPENEKSLYRRYSHIYEDSQYDDLTILAVEKK